MSIRRRRHHQEVDLEITPFMNLMIILVPFLLITMVFSQITVLDSKVANQKADESITQDEPQDQLELVIRKDYLDVNYPPGTRQKRIAKTVDGEYDTVQLVEILKELKRRMKEEGIEKRDIILMPEKDIDYQSIITIMDSVRSFVPDVQPVSSPGPDQTVVDTAKVDKKAAELFPDIILGKAKDIEVVQ